MTWLGTLAFVREHWKWAAIAALAAALMITRGTLASARADFDKLQLQRQIDAATAAGDKARTETRWANNQVAAVERYAQAIATRDPIILRSKDTVREYAQTAAGAMRCLSPERVLGIDQLDRELFPFTPADPRRPARAVHPDAGAPAS
ncbi:MAG: hypothetical protein JWQ16_1754 [Novosphingobium sp.]|nr:hypothetical protein [Novosphingobium sp.]